MIIQPYDLLANTQTETGRIGDSKSSINIDNVATKNESINLRKTDSLSLSVEGMIAYGNQVLRERAVSELNRVLQELDSDSKPIEELDPTEHTPDKTADFIVSMSTGFFDVYANGHPELEKQGLLDGFMEVISGGIKRGLEAARDILYGLDVLNGNVKEGIDTTESRIWEKLNLFYEEKLSSWSTTTS